MRATGEWKLGSLAEEYLDRAEDCRRQAQNTPLPRVREKCLRAAEAWDKLGERRAAFEALQQQTGPPATPRQKRALAKAWPHLAEPQALFGRRAS